VAVGKLLGIYQRGTCLRPASHDGLQCRPTAGLEKNGGLEARDLFSGGDINGRGDRYHTKLTWGKDGLRRVGNATEQRKISTKGGSSWPIFAKKDPRLSTRLLKGLGFWIKVMLVGPTR